MYQLLCSIDSDPSQTGLQGEEGRSWSMNEMDQVSIPLDALDRMTLADSLSYLTDDILQKVDRAAMSVSLETRVPFLDKDVVEFSCHVPPSMKIQNGQGKWLVRQGVARYGSRTRIVWGKTGFCIPLHRWRP